MTGFVFLFIVVVFLDMGNGKKKEEVGVLSLLPQQLVLFGLQWRTKGRFFILLQVFNTNKYHTFFENI